MCDAPPVFKELSLGDVLAVLVLVPLAAIGSMIILFLEWVLANSRVFKRNSI